MTTHFINYVLLAIGITTVLGAVIIIFLDKLKGDDIYFSIDVKEQEIKKVIEDAEEILSELNFTSDVIVKEIEDKINNLNIIFNKVNNSIAEAKEAAASVEQAAPKQPSIPQQNPPVIERTVVPVKFKPITAVNKSTSDKDKPQTKAQMVQDMASQGLSIVDIAKKLNMGQGEVSLILSLKNEEK